MPPIKKILIANRGEIALRVMRTAREMGIATVAIYSEADREALHVRYADEAICIGPPPSAESYLRGDKIIDAALRLRVDAIHPGYGFLSENAAFARAVGEAGLIFIGPSPEAIETMGSKLAAKRAAGERNIPMVPGTDGAITDRNEAKRISAQIGYPILIKASAGGGGKGMRVVEKPEDFDEQMDRAVSEAVSSFGDGSVFIEKYITSPRHIEIQLLGDQHGNIIHLFERECSVQRRHQKVVEEAPSLVLTPEIREAMGRCAVEVGHACGYYGAGTVEFIVDDSLAFYFLEMNTRLQVEHPVTEQITGVDLVRQMIYIAEGKPLEIKQEDLAIRGHAMEVRVYAEDPATNFLPDVGTLQTYIRPQGNGVRLDDGFEQGMAIPIHYDPMIAKLVTYGQDREEAIVKMIRAIDEYRITGVQTTLSFGRFVMEHEAFRSGQFDTHFVSKYFTPDRLETEFDTVYVELAALIAGQILEKGNSAKASKSELPITKNNWKTRRR
ncbi:acetyl-CoA carboxylase biotin carboxylase subunit [Persicitalea jodogahamensis]|uniref:Acetyl-CoA carboxylase biotin carboxylase subunit n=1 Tax=Persicitalea jodogahamensis TaxID=402147 RepID=A0A8J3D6K4_9BACT|nr:acetyl-CoA carboxylase biotin carboxylase subunit [Persicitalea jodogahamensis]GHB53656.1 acetyl-CoA carboxylase biotin carboxylase subunit [Persicitalea jodogahamensis]